MLVLLGHDIIPHHHHLEQKHETQVSLVRVHQHVHQHSSCNHKQNGASHWNHQQEKSNETCCQLTHHRVQKELKFQVFLPAQFIQLNSLAKQNIQKLTLRNYKLIAEIYRLTPPFRGPPHSSLA
jgi:hypothetical protein